MNEMDKVRETVDYEVDALFHEMWGVSLDIHSHPQVGFNETHASSLCREVMERHGFAVGDACDGLPTAFRAAWGEGSPRIAVFAEYDALPGLGHACGHNLIATSAMLSAVAAKKAATELGLNGTIEVFGTPAEEDGGGKIIMLNRGAFDGLDAVFLMHPTSATTRIGGECTSFDGMYVTFAGKPAHAESHPEEGINAMDAASLFHQALGVSRQQLPDDVHVGDVILEISNDIGQIPSSAKLEVEVSSTVGSHVAPAMAVAERCARGIATATGCEVNIEVLGGYLGRIPNSVLGDITREELRVAGEPVMDGMPSDKGGEDLGDVSRVIPSCNIFGTILPERKISGHTVEFRDLAISENAQHCLRVTSKAMASSICRLLMEPQLLSEAKAELELRLAAE